MRGDAETGEALGVVEHRSAKALRAFLAKQGHRWLKGVEVVVTDGSDAYRAAIQTHLSHATHVVDRFHAVRWFATGLIEVRRRIQRTGDKGKRPAFDPSIFRSRYLQLTRRDHLNTAGQGVSDPLSKNDHERTATTSAALSRSTVVKDPSGPYVGVQSGSWRR